MGKCCLERVRLWERIGLFVMAARIFEIAVEGGACSEPWSTGRTAPSEALSRRPGSVARLRGKVARDR
jgi:hypothetical protein